MLETSTCKPKNSKSSKWWFMKKYRYGLLPLFFASLFFLNPSKSQSQVVAAWGDAAPAAWTASTLNDARSDYFQGEVLPFVYKFVSTGLLNGSSYTFNIKYDHYIGSGNAGGYAYMTTYNLSRSPDLTTYGSPTLDATGTTANVGNFYTINADITSAAFLADDVSGTTVSKVVQVTFTFTGTPGDDVVVYWGLFLSKKGSVPGTPVTEGAAHWPGGSLQVTLTGTGGGGNVGNNPGAGGVVEGVISGVKYRDADQSGDKNGSEAGLSGWTIYLDLDNSNTLNDGDVSTTTAGDGSYSFGDLLPGSFTVREENQTGWTQTEPGSGAGYEYSIVLDAVNFNHPNKNFGNYECPTNGGTATATASPICSGTGTTVTLTDHVGSIVKWQWSTDGETWNDIVSTSNPYNTGNLTATTQFRAVVQSGACNEQTSVPAVVTVDAASVGGSAAAAVSPICTGSSTTVQLSGNTGAIVKWQYSTDGSTWYDIASTANPINTGALTATTQFRAVVQNGACTSTESIAATVTVNAASVGGSAAAALSPICSGSSTTVSLSGQTGNVVKWQYSTDGSTWYDIASTATSINTGPLTVNTQFHAIVQNGACSSATSLNATVNITSPISFTPLSNQTVSYPNNATFTITASNVTGYQWYEKSTAGGAVFTILGGQTSASLLLTSPPVSKNGYQYKVVMTGISPCLKDSSTATLYVNPATLCLTYDGLTFGVTNSNGCYVENTGYGAGVIRLIMTVVGSPVGDLSTAVVKVSIAGAFSNQTATYVAASGSNPAYFYYDWSPTSGTAACFGSTVNSNIYELTWTIGGNYSNGTCNETGALITISRPSQDFTTGGGYIFNNKSKGTIGIATNETPAKNNYGFNLKWGNNLKNLQGNFNTIVRQGGKQYQIKSNKPTYLTTIALAPYTIGAKTYYPYEAIMVYENAVFKDLTTGTSQGGGPTSLVYLRVTDNGEPNSAGTPRIDSISIFYKLNNVVIYSSEAYTVTTNPALIKLMAIVKGNIQVHVQGAKAETRETAQMIDQTQMFEITAAPNPTPSSFRIRINGDNSNSRLQLKVMDILGRTVQSFNSLSSGTTLTIGAAYKPGVYFVELSDGNKKKQLKLVKVK